MHTHRQGNGINREVQITGFSVEVGKIQAEADFSPPQRPGQEKIEQAG